MSNNTEQTKFKPVTRELVEGMVAYRSRNGGYASFADGDRYMNQSIIQFKQLSCLRYIRWLREVKGNSAAEEKVRETINRIE